MVNEYELKKQNCDIGKRIYNRNMVAANDGNISVKLNDHEFLCTPTGVSKGFMTPDYICRVNEKGEVIQANPGFKPSSESLCQETGCGLCCPCASCLRDELCDRGDSSDPAYYAGGGHRPGLRADR